MLLSFFFVLTVASIILHGEIRVRMAEKQIDKLRAQTDQLIAVVGGGEDPRQLTSGQDQMPDFENQLLLYKKLANHERAVVAKKMFDRLSPSQLGRVLDETPAYERAGVADFLLKR